MNNLVLRFRLETMLRTLQDVGRVRSALAMARQDLHSLDSLFRSVPGDTERELIGLNALTVHQKLRNSIERLELNPPDDASVLHELRAALEVSAKVMSSAKGASEVVERLRQRWVEIDDPNTIGQTLDRELIRDAKSTRTDVKALHDALGEADEAALAELWRKWHEKLVGSRPLLDEYLDLLGGLALRTVGLCHDVCGRADTLLQLLVQRSSGPRWSSVAVPAHVEVLRMTPSQIIRLGFPGWTIWELPLAAHEFGYVIGGVESAKELVPEAGDRIGAGALAALYADGFAAFALGPAYACAALLLRLDPTRSVGAEAGEPSDPVRARMICATLRAVDPAFQAIVDKLNGQWHAALAQAGGSPIDERQGEDVDAWCEAVVKTLRIEAPYAEYSARRWARITSWVSKHLECPIGDGSTDADRRDVVDVLNAAWVCRLDSPDLTEALTERAAKLWDAVKGSDVRTGNSGSQILAGPPNLPDKQP